jgi:hypothetical protein
MPGDVLAAVQHPLYAAGEPKNCKPTAPKLKLPSTKMDKGLNEFIMFVFLFLAMFLAIVLAIAFVNSDVLKPFAAGLTRLFAWRTPRPGSVSAASPPSVSTGLSGLLSSRPPKPETPLADASGGIMSKLSSLFGR